VTDVGDLAVDTAVEAIGDGRYRAFVSPDWEIWGPMGGYVAAIALRAAAAASSHPVPVALSCHYLGVARFEPVEIEVVALKEGRAAASHRVQITQDGRPVLAALVWSVAGGDGLEHDESVAPDVPGPDGLPTLAELFADADDGPSFAFWDNLDAKPIDFERDWPPDGPRPAVFREWLRFTPTETWDDPWLDAARSVVLVDLPSWPAAHRPHAWTQPAFTAPTLDLNVAFHRHAGGEPWLLCDGAAPVSTGGTFGWNARVWSPGGGLYASGGGQCIYRPMR